MLTLLGRDLYAVEVADAVIVDARERRGLGVGTEMMASRLYGTLLVAVVPPDSHYRQSNMAVRGTTLDAYVHPHLLGLCDAIVSDFETAGRELTRLAGTVSAVDTQRRLADARRAFEKFLRTDDPDLRDL